MLNYNCGFHSCGDCGESAKYLVRKVSDKGEIEMRDKTEILREFQETIGRKHKAISNAELDVSEAIVCLQSQRPNIPMALGRLLRALKTLREN